VTIRVPFSFFFIYRFVSLLSQRLSAVVDASLAASVLVVCVKFGLTAGFCQQRPAGFSLQGVFPFNEDSDSILNPSLF